MGLSFERGTNDRKSEYLTNVLLQFEIWSVVFFNTEYRRKTHMEDTCLNKKQLSVLIYVSDTIILEILSDHFRTIKVSGKRVPRMLTPAKKKSIIS